MRVPDIGDESPLSFPTSRSVKWRTVLDFVHSSIARWQYSRLEHAKGHTGPDDDGPAMSRKRVPPEVTAGGEGGKKPEVTPISARALSLTPQLL